MSIYSEKISLKYNDKSILEDINIEIKKGMILSILYKHTPETCRLILVDPKMLELSVYDGIPHLLTPVVTEPSKAVMALK